MMAKAVVFTRKGEVALQEIEVPSLRPDEILVRAHTTGVSTGTEGWVLNDKFKRTGHLQYPLVPGYQRAGWVEAVGAAVTEFKVGDRVVGTGCRLEGGVVSNWAGHTHYGVHPQHDLYHIPDHVSFATAAQLVVAQVGYNAATRWPFAAGQTVMVIGDGCVGQFAAQSARALGAKVVVAGHRQGRMELARKYSADEVISTRNEEWMTRFTRPDSPVSVVIDTVQSDDLFNSYKMQLCRKTNVILSGYSPWGFKIDIGEFHSRELGLLSISGWSAEKNRATIALMASGQINVEGLLTHTVSVDDAPGIYEMLQKKAAHFLAVNFEWE